MAVRAIKTNTGMSVKKLKPVVNLVRGRRVEDALRTLQFLMSPAASHVAKAVKSAAANAESELLSRTSELLITAISADEGPRLKRFRPRARGRAARIMKRSSHITVVVDEEES